jgi:hypothetical protein
MIQFIVKSVCLSVWKSIELYCHGRVRRLFFKSCPYRPRSLSCFIAQTLLSFQFRFIVSIITILKSSWLYPTCHSHLLPASKFSIQLRPSSSFVGGNNPFAVPFYINALPYFVFSPLPILSYCIAIDITFAFILSVHDMATKRYVKMHTISLSYVASSPSMCELTRPKNQPPHRNWLVGMTRLCGAQVLGHYLLKSISCILRITFSDILGH